MKKVDAEEDEVEDLGGPPVVKGDEKKRLMMNKKVKQDELLLKVPKGVTKKR